MKEPPTVLRITMEAKYDKIGIDYNLTRKADNYFNRKAVQ
jgi:hypothetical protein